MENAQSEMNDEKETRFNVVVDGIPYQVVVSPFEFNNEKRFTIMVNNGPRDIFAWDREMKMYKGLDDQSAILPDGLMLEINSRLLESQK